jgi:hypothetical protein
VVISHYAGAHLDQFQRVMADPASVSAVHLGDGPPRILLVNDTGSLRRFAPTPWEEVERGRRPGRRRRDGDGSSTRDGRERKLRG